MRLPWVLLALVTLGYASPARAYPWLLGEASSQCASCHADPSGAGLLTAYGRSAGADLLSTFDATKHRAALFGLAPEPSWLLYSWAFRGAAFSTVREGSPLSGRLITMQADLRAQVTLLSRLRVNGSVGFVPYGGQLAPLRPDAPLQFVSREHWIGVDLGARRELLLRAGRIALPYGLRGNEHPMWVRSATRTDISFHQQHGVALSRSGASYRTEWMVVLGNYQVAPDLWRERGYAGYYEHQLGERAAAGFSSLLTRAQGDLFVSRREPVTRQAHGVFARVAVRPWAVLMAQADLVVRRTRDRTHGAVALAQAELRVTRGFRLLPALELEQPRLDTGEPNAGAWLSALFFPYAHLETRLDLVGRSYATPSGRQGGATALLSLHIYL